MTTPQELVACIEKFASLPSVYQRIRALLADPDSSTEQLAIAVSRDPGISARVLRVVNSVLFGFPGKVESLGRAVNLMGMQQVHDLVLSTSVLSAFASVRPARFDMTHFWRDSIFRGLAARAAARQLGLGDPERMFVEGLLADIGHLVMAQAIPEAAAVAQALARRTGCPLHEAEQAQIGCHFAEVGAALAMAWDLPTGFAAAIGAQIQPALAGQHATEAALLHMANVLLASEADSVDEDAVLTRIDATSLSMLELDPARLAAIRARAREELAAVAALFLPGPG